MLENTEVKIYDDYIVNDINVQKRYIDNIIINLTQNLMRNNK